MMRAFRIAPGRSLFALLLAMLPLPMVYGDALPDTEERLTDGLKYLASDELEGRGVGTEGLDKAAEFIRDEFEKAGLDVTKVDGGAFQSFEITTGSELGDRNELTFVGPNDRSIALEHDQDFRTCSFGGSGTLDAAIVFVGYGIEAADENYNDFEGVDLQGKVALILRRVPRQSDPEGPFAGPHGGVSRHAELRSKVSNAFSKGAAAVLLVNDPYTSRNETAQLRDQFAKAEKKFLESQEALTRIDPQDAGAIEAARKQLAEAQQHLENVRELVEAPTTDRLIEFGYGGDGKEDSIPVFHITQDAADRLLQASLGRSLADLEAAIDKDLRPQSAPLDGWKARGEASLKRVRTEIRNVIGVLEGEGPLADETVVIGAHYDHVGWGGPGSGSLAVDPHNPVKAVHNGADDNASGTVALIELARRLSGQKLPRRVVFIAFTAEETGLIGSAHYVKEPLYPLEKTVAMLNMDMVGRLDEDTLTVFGTGTSPVWKERLSAAAASRTLKLVFKPEGFGPSDHSSFYAKQIPVLHFFTGAHADYHRPSDDWDKINYDGMLRVIDLIEEVAGQTIRDPERPEYVKVQGKAELARTGSRPYFGSIPDFGTEGTGYAISGVSPGSPADKGGLKGGDRIVRMGDNKIGSLEDFDLALRKFKPGEQVEVVVLRDGEEVSLKVTLGTPRQ